MAFSYQRKCEGTTKAGVACGSFAVKDSRFCVRHDPEASQSPRLLHRGTYRKRKGEPQPAPEIDQVQLQALMVGITNLKRTEDLSRLSEGVIAATISGRLKPDQCRAITSAIANHRALIVDKAKMKKINDLIERWEQGNRKRLV